MDARKQPVFGLIIIGDEILSGKRADKHLAKVIEILGARGLALSWAEYVGDDRGRITAALSRAFACGDVVFSCGGIGATPDDHTRQCAAAALGRPLVLHPLAEQLIRERMQDVAREQGQDYEPDRPDNIHRLNMGVFPEGAQIIPNPYNKIPGFYVLGGSEPHAVGERGGGRFVAGPPQGESAPLGGVYFFPGFPVMAWPMMEWVLDQHHAHCFNKVDTTEKSVIVYGAMEAALTPLMEAVERDQPGVKVFSLPSVDHPVHGRHIELGVKGDAQRLDAAYAQLLQGLRDQDAKLGPEIVR